MNKIPSSLICTSDSAESNLGTAAFMKRTKVRSPRNKRLLELVRVFLSILNEVDVLVMQEKSMMKVYLKRVSLFVLPMMSSLLSGYFQGTRSMSMRLPAASLNEVKSFLN